MNHNSRLMLGVLVVVGALAAALALSWRPVTALPMVAGDGPGGRRDRAGEAAPVPVEPVPGGPGFYSLHAAAFRPYASTMSWAFFGDELYNPGGTDSDLQAEVSLPNGATITKFVVYYYDDCSTHDMAVRLERSAASSDVTQPIAEATTSGNETSYRYAEDSTIDWPVVDQQIYAYRVIVLIPQGCDIGLSLESVRIDYGYGVSLPIAVRGQ